MARHHQVFERIVDRQMALDKPVLGDAVVGFKLQRMTNREVVTHELVAINTAQLAELSKRLTLQPKTVATIQRDGLAVVLGHLDAALIPAGVATQTI